ncbi:MAG: tRNA (N(6)-L-threonylcarbamoyladenosine(37)-C(2))-methylthiotransferase MtaB [Thiohalocapsa sp.]|jgi:threonylcarbamoyladenosine tRNA methylthiotransferase MtaB
MRVRLHTLGCRLNEAEIEQWARQLRRRGCTVTDGAECADLVVVNTCAVTGEALRKSRKLLRRVQRDNPRARLVVSGCAASLDDEALETGGIDLLVPNTEKDRLVDIAVDALRLPLMPAAATEPAADALFARGRQRAFIKIQDGCRHQCSFCITTRARGAERSRPASEICDEINALSAEGVREVVLTGVHAGGYGRDLGDSLTGLLERVLGETEVPRIRLGSVEPWDLPDRFWRLFDDARLLPHLHLPLQSGADTVLKRMARRCRSGAFERLVATGRDRIADLNVTTDIIVGFPGETEDDWRQTIALVERVGFGQLHIFPYSPRTGTPAAAMPHQVPDAVKRERSRQLHALGLELKRTTLARYAGRVMPILVEGEYRDGTGLYHAGLTPNYLPVRLRGIAPERVNRIIDVRLGAIVPGEEVLDGIPCG